MKKILLFSILTACLTVSAEEVVYDNQGKLIELSQLSATYAECSDQRYAAKITKIEGKYPELDLWFKSINGKKVDAVTLPLRELSMATIRSLDNLVYKGSSVYVHIQYCGSGALPYLISLKAASKSTVRK